MIPVATFAGKTAAIFGLGRSGLAAADAIVAGGGSVIVWDDSQAPRETAAARGFEVRDLRGVDFADVDALVLSPGVPLTHPAPHWTVELAHAADVPVIGDTELLVGELEGHARLVAITGTNGKSTTTALAGHMLEHAGLDVRIGGNIGTPVLSLPPPGADTTFVVEFSSYQIDLTPSLKPQVGVLLNITPDHLDRHGTLERYAAVKARIFARQSAGDTAICGVDDELCRKIYSEIPPDAERVAVAVEHPIESGVQVDGTEILIRRDGRFEKVAELLGIATLRGSHNAQNAAAACAIALACGISADKLQAALASFPGLAHRLEQVGRIGSTLFINDSKATNAEAASRALACFDRIFWIAGGLAKYGGIENLKEFFPKIEKAYLIGEAAPAFAETLGDQARWELSETLATAVEHAAADAVKEGEEAVVLLSPACASFDQFANFEIRGEAFRRAVQQLPGLEEE